MNPYRTPAEIPRESVYYPIIDWGFIVEIVIYSSIFFAEIGFFAWAIYKVAT